MNEFASEIVRVFASQQNRDYCKSRVRSIVGEDADVFLRSDFNRVHLNYVTVIAREIMLSDPMPGTEIRDHVNSFNHQFIQTIIDFMHAHVLCEDVAIYSIGDGAPTSRTQNAACAKRPSQLLDEWRDMPGKLTQMREDPSADAHPHIYGEGAGFAHSGITFCDQSRMGTSHHSDQFYRHTYLNSLNDVHPATSSSVGGRELAPTATNSNASRGTVPTANYYLPANSLANMHPASHQYGVQQEHYDERSRWRNTEEHYDTGPSATKLGPQHHMQYRTGHQRNHFAGTSMVESPLGNMVPNIDHGPGCHTNYAFGNSTREGDERLLERRTFRSAHADCENGIPRYEQRLQRRNIDRDITENIRPFEHDGMLYKHDMDSLYARTNYKNNYNTQYPPRSDVY